MPDNYHDDYGLISVIFGVIRLTGGPFESWEVYDNGDIVYDDEVIRINRQEIKVGYHYYYFRRGNPYLRNVSAEDRDFSLLPHHRHPRLPEGYYQIVTPHMAVSFVNRQFFIIIDPSPPSSPSPARLYQVLPHHEIIYSDYHHRYLHSIPKFLRLKGTFFTQWMIHPAPNVGFLEFSDRGTSRLMTFSLDQGSPRVEDVRSENDVLSFTFHGSPHHRCTVSHNGKLREKSPRYFRRWGVYFANRTH